LRTVARLGMFVSYEANVIDHCETHASVNDPAFYSEAPAICNRK